MIATSEKVKLAERGYVDLPRIMSADLLARLRRAVEERFALEGDDAGSDFKQEPGCRRLANLGDEGDVFREISAMPAILGWVRSVLGPAIKLSSLNARVVPAHCDVVQLLHADMGAVADERGFWVCNTVWLLDPFTRDNGAIRCIPGSHRWGKLPGDGTTRQGEEFLITADAGDVIVM